jgi:hypothetical protein
MICSTALSAKGAKCKSLGHRPREMQAVATALKARNFRVADEVLLAIRVVTSLLCMSRFQRFLSDVTCPGAMPQAFAFRALGA